jgi:hypothetical protein
MIDGYIWPVSSLITIGNDSYASLWGTMELMKQRFIQLTSDSFKGDSGQGGNNGTGIMVTAGFNWKTKLLSLGLVVRGAVGTQFKPNIYQLSSLMYPLNLMHRSRFK